MGTSLLEVQRNVILNTIRQTVGNDWKVLVVDEGSRKIIDNVVKEDDILNLNVTNIEQIEQRRPANPDTDAVYILSPLPHIVDCVVADLQRRRYRRAYLIWISSLSSHLRSRITSLDLPRDQIADFRSMSIDYFPRESHLAVFRDPWSFPTLFHPGCNNLIRRHLEELAQKIVSVCVSLEEYPLIRYYRPRSPRHEAAVMCSHLARFVQEGLDGYAKYRKDFPPPSPRPRGVLYIVDRSMDLVAPLVHEFTYQAMAHDLLPIREGDKVTYKTVINEGKANEEAKDMELSENDRIWVDSRHLHMKDLLGKLVEDFNKFRASNPQFADSDATSNVNVIKDMLAGLSEFQEGKNAYTLHLNIAQEAMSNFQSRNLADIATLEQSLATGLDEDYKKPKDVAEQLVRLLDDERVGPSDRLRLIILYLLYRDGLLAGDIKKVLAHSQLPPRDGEVMYNFDLLGAKVEKPLKETTPPTLPLFVRNPPAQPIPEDAVLSRYDTNVKIMLQEHIRGTLDSSTFPSTRPHLDGDGVMSNDSVSQASLRSAKPTWARTRPSAAEPRQRIIVFMAGGATYSEARACYEISQEHAKDVYLVTSHMLTPGLFLRQVGDLSVDKRRLDLPAERPPPKTPAHLLEKETAPAPAPTGSPAPPTAGMAAMNLGRKPQAVPAAQPQATPPSGKPPKPKEEKKRRHFFR